MILHERRFGFGGYTKVLKRTLDELFDVVEPVSDGGIELARCAHEIEESGRAHLICGKASQLAELLGVWLRSCNDQAQTVFWTVGRRVDHSTDEVSD